MNVYVVEGRIRYEGSSVLGTYPTRESAVEAARAFEVTNRAEEYPIDFDYYVHEVVLGEPLRDRWHEGEAVQMEGV